MVTTVLIITYAALIIAYVKYEQMKRKRDFWKAREKMLRLSQHNNVDMWNSEK